MSPARSGRRFLVPEVVQTSAMDCGPAALACLLGGFGIRASYGRLREACQTDVDGTSIDVIEVVAQQLGLDAQQVVVPLDHLLLAEGGVLPAVVVVALPNGAAHFVVAWRRHGRRVQVMDPGRGRRWPTCRRFIEDVYVHQMPVPSGAWREWAASDEFTVPLRERMKALGVARDECANLVKDALSDEGWRSLAALDAAVRMAASLLESRSLRPGAEALKLVGALSSRAKETAADAEPIIPLSFWSAHREAPAEDGTEQVRLRGAVALRVRGVRESVPSADDEEPKLTPELAAALDEAPLRPWERLLELVRVDGVLPPLSVAGAIALGAGAVVLQALLFRALIDVSRDLATPADRGVAIAVLLSFLTAMLVLELPVAVGLRRLGRALETRLRLGFLQKIPLLSDRYFASRLSSDMAQRSHAIHRVRDLPDLAGRFVRLSTRILVTTIGLAWLAPASAPFALIAAALALGLPLLAQRFLVERDLRVQNHAGALSRFYLDGLLGLVAIRTHGAERTVRREHDGLLVEWARSAVGLLRMEVLVEVVVFAAGFGAAAALILHHVATGQDGSVVLLLAYWALELPVLGEALGQVAQQLPSQRNTTLRLLEPLGAPEESAEAELVPQPGARGELSAPGVSVRLEGVGVIAGGHRILGGVSLDVEAGEQVAVVGPSGAGKSTLVGLLLGWHRAAEGRVQVDGEELNGARLTQLRRETAWVDPAVALWNRSLLDNVRYGADAADAGPAIRAADLRTVVESLENGLQTQLGEGGALLSGGEGQRVRLARAFHRGSVRLVLLDEPFRGLDRPRRRELLARARKLWSGATLICVTHDISETSDFDRVLVVEGGRLVEEGSPSELAADATSRHAALLAADEELREGTWRGSGWRHLSLRDGDLVEEPSS